MTSSINDRNSGGATPANSPAAASNDRPFIDDKGSGGTDNATKPRLPFPHDRDEAADQQGHPIEPIIEQARQDVVTGKQDTDLRGTAAEKFDDKFGPRREHGTPRTDQK